MRIKCRACGFSEPVNLDLFVKIMGTATAGFGAWAWVSFLFAGTGFAMAICIAIVAGGTAMLAYKDEIVKWIANRGYKCQKCGNQNWVPVPAELANEGLRCGAKTQSGTPCQNKPEPGKDRCRLHGDK